MNEVAIPLGVTGEITNSAHPGHRVRVESDEENTGGFLIYVWWEASEGPNANGAFDGWAETMQETEKYFQESGWKIAWLQC